MAKKQGQNGDKSLSNHIPDMCLEKTPVKFWKTVEDNPSTAVNVFVNKGEEEQKPFEAAIKQIVGVEDSELTLHILHTGASTAKPIAGEVSGLNIADAGCMEVKASALKQKKAGSS